MILWLCQDADLLSMWGVYKLEEADPHTLMNPSQSLVNVQRVNITMTKTLNFLVKRHNLETLSALQALYEGVH